MTTESDVHAASETFYAALNSMLNGDAGPLAEIWSHGPEVTTMHPIGGREVGWERVMEAWTQVAKACSDGQITLGNRMLQVAGDIAYELGVERGTFSLAGQPVTVESRITNIYRREAGAWKIVHHHADLSPAMIEALGPPET